MEKIDFFEEKINSLPTFSPVKKNLLAVAAKPDSSAGDIVEILKLDPSLAAKVIRLANSAYIGIPRSISSLDNAVVILGNRRIYSLALVSTTVAAFVQKTQLPFNVFKFWRHSTIVAFIAESIARHIKRYETLDEAEIFCAGLLHDIGKLAIGVFSPREMIETYQKTKQKNIAYHVAENSQVSHEKIGELIAQKWNFAPVLKNSIFYHHQPLGAGVFTNSAAIVHMADVMSHVMGCSLFDVEIGPVLDIETMEKIRLQPERLRVIAITEIEKQKKIESMINFVS